MKLEEERLRTCFAYSVGRTLFKDGVGLDGLRPLSPPPSVLSHPLIPVSSLLFWSHMDLFLYPGEQSDIMYIIIKDYILTAKKYAMLSLLNRRLKTLY